MSDLKENNPTLEEVIKEWEELGYKLTRHERCLLEFTKNDMFLKIYNIGNVITYEKQAYGYSQRITFKEHQLLTKTFKALGVV